MTWRKINTDLIPWSDYVEELYHPDGDTSQIIDAVLEGDSEHDTRFQDFARQFSKDRKGLKLLWSFTKYAIPYKEDGFNVQDVKLAAALWKIRKGDCKSKTLFINQVLKCLEIPYITRFVGYDGEKITHVYSIAFLNGKPIILDSVFHYFNAEPRHNTREDFDMTKISIIRGIPKENKSIGTAQEDLYFQVQADAMKRYEEIQQRKQYVQPEPPINFAKMSEGAALSELLIRKLKIIGTMKDEQKATTEKGISLIRRSIETGKVSGVISDDLQGVAARLNYYLSLNGSAVGHGYRGKALDLMKRGAKAYNIGAIPGVECLITKLYYEGNGGAGTQIDPFRYKETAQGTSFLALMNCDPITLNHINSISNNTYFYYGRNTNFRTKLVNSGQRFNQIINAFIAANPTLISSVGNGKYRFQTQAAYDTLLEELKQKMPVLSNWANDLFRADNTRPDGTVGTGLLYNFVPDLTQIAAITPGNFPSVVQTKMVFQQQYIDSCVNFSTISRTIFEDMSENGILFDNGGETPERILSALIQQYNPSIGLAPGVAELIVGLVTIVLTTVLAIVETCNDGANDASEIDNAAKDTAAFKTQSQSTMPNMSDFTPLTQTGGGGSGGGSGSGGGGNNNNNNNNNGSKKGSSIIPVVAAAATGGYLYSKRKKKKN